MLAARATFAEPAARGLDPRKFATSVVVMGGGQIASRQALATWVSAALDGRGVQSPQRPEAHRVPVARANADPPPGGEVVVHAPPIAVTSTLAADARESASDSAPALPPSEAGLALENAGASGPAAQPSDVAPAVESASDSAPASHPSELPVALPVAPRKSLGRTGSHALLAVVAIALVMAIATSAQVAHRSAQPSEGSDVAGRIAHEARTGGDPADEEGDTARPALAAGSAQGDSKPGCPRPHPQDDGLGNHAGGRSVDEKGSDAVVLKPASGTVRPRARQKSESTREPDYGI
jgi:hypothetical protein